MERSDEFSPGESGLRATRTSLAPSTRCRASHPNLNPRPHSRAEEARGSCGPRPTALSDSRFPLIRLATLLPADWPPPLGGPLQRAVGSKAGKAVICVVTSTHFSIGAGERADAPGSSDALWEGEGKWWRGGDGGSWGKSGGWSRGPRGPFRAWD